MSPLWRQLRAFLVGIVIAPVAIVGIIACMFYDRVWLATAIFVAMLVLRFFYTPEDMENDMRSGDHHK